MLDAHNGIYIKVLDDKVTAGIKCRSLSLGLTPLKFCWNPLRQLLGS